MTLKRYIPTQIEGKWYVLDTLDPRNRSVECASEAIAIVNATVWNRFEDPFAESVTV